MAGKPIVPDEVVRTLIAGQIRLKRSRGRGWELVKRRGYPIGRSRWYRLWEEVERARRPAIRAG